MIAPDDTMDTAHVLEETCEDDELLDMDDDGSPFVASSLILHDPYTCRYCQSIEMEQPDSHGWDLVLMPLQILVWNT